MVRLRLGKKGNIIRNVFMIVFMMQGMGAVLHAQTEIILENYFRTLRSVKVEINHKTYDFLFDTGGGLTMVSPEIAKDLGKPVYGNSVGFRMNGERVDTKLCDSVLVNMGGVDFGHVTVGVFDIMSLLPEEFKRIDGVISLKTFEDRKITLDLRRNKLIVETDESFEKQIGDMRSTPCRFANGTNGADLNLLVGVEVLSRLWWFLLDTGNIAHPRISEKVVAKWALKESGQDQTVIPGCKLELGGSAFETPVTVENIIYDGVLNYDLIEKMEVAISLKDEKVWIRTVEGTPIGEAERK